MVKLNRTKQQDKKFDGDYTYIKNDNLYIITYWDSRWVLELRTTKLSDTLIESFKLLKDLKEYLYRMNTITWKKDSVAFPCEITGIRTQWIAKTEHGQIRCFRDANVIDFKTVIWNRIIDKNMEQNRRTFEKLGVK